MLLTETYVVLLSMPAGVLLDVLSVTFLVPGLHVQVEILKGYLPLSLKSFHQLTSLSQNHSGIIHQILYGNLNKGPLVVQSDGFAVNKSSRNGKNFLRPLFTSKRLYENTICCSGRKEKVQPIREAV